MSTRLPHGMPDRLPLVRALVRGEHREPVAVDADHLGPLRRRLPTEHPAVGDERVGVVVVHVLDDPRGVRSQRIGLGRRVVVGRDPAHPAEPAHVADRGDLEPVEAEVVERGVEGVGVPLAVGLQRRLARVVAQLDDGAEDGDAGQRERVARSRLGRPSATPADRRRGCGCARPGRTGTGAAVRRRRRRRRPASRTGTRRRRRRWPAPGVRRREQRPSALGVGGLAADAGRRGERAGGLGAGVFWNAMVAVRGDSSGHRASRQRS